MGQEGPTCGIVKTHTPRLVTHKQEDNYNCRGSPQEARGPSTLDFLAWGLALGRTPPERLALKPSGAYFPEGQRAVGNNRDSTLKGCTQNLTCSRTQGRSSNLKGAWIRPTC